MQYIKGKRDAACVNGRVLSAVKPIGENERGKASPPSLLKRTVPFQSRLQCDSDSWLL